MSLPAALFLLISPPSSYLRVSVVLSQVSVFSLGEKKNEQETSAGVVSTCGAAFCLLPSARRFFFFLRHPPQVDFTVNQTHKLEIWFILFIQLSVEVELKCTNAVFLVYFLCS